MSGNNEVIYQQTDPRVIAAAAQKREKVRAWLHKSGLDGVILSRRDNFAWVTCGGDNRVVNTQTNGYGHIVITRSKDYLVSYYMDADRYQEEQVAGQGYELVTIYWYEGDERARALKLAGDKVGADTCYPGTVDVSAEILDLHWPLNEIEVARTRWLAQQDSQVLEKVLRQVQPGMTERQIHTLLQMEVIQRGMELEVPIVGSDERIHKYRHVLPTDKLLERYLMLGPVVTRWGLHALVSRSVHFGEPPVEVQKAFIAAATIEGRVIAGLQEGLKFSAILERQKAWYEELGIVDGWKYHFPGGPTGYTLVDAGRSQTDKAVQCPQPFSWFTTVRGAKVEETSMLTDAGVEICSMPSDWPLVEIITDRGPFRVPGMLIR